MFSIYENNKKISGACRSFVLCLDYVAISPFIYFKVFQCFSYLFAILSDICCSEEYPTNIAPIIRLL